MRIISFSADATPRVGTMLAYNQMRGIANPLTARGVVLEGDFAPIVLACLDWLGVSGAAHRHMRQVLAQAAGTSPERVALHVVHQHDAPRAEPAAQERIRALDLPRHDQGMDQVVPLAEDLARSMELSRAEAVEVTHLGTGQAEVERVASTRRVPGEDGKVAFRRMSSCADEAARAAPEGLIDPMLRLVSFWRGDQPVLGLAYYACHPQSYYRTGLADADFPGLARNRAGLETGAAHIYFTGAAGNVAAGKWNDGSREARHRLTERLTSAYRTAWARTERVEIKDDEVGWDRVEVELPLAPHMRDREALEAVARDRGQEDHARITAARHLGMLDDLHDAPTTDLTLLRLGPAWIVHGPSELLLEYQLFARSLRPDRFVAMAAYGDGRYLYIGTSTTRQEGGYEGQDSVNRVADEGEAVLQDALRSLLIKRQRG